MPVLARLRDHRRLVLVSGAVALVPYVFFHLLYALTTLVHGTP